jgi:hypothetical protein
MLGWARRARRGWNASNDLGPHGRGAAWPLEGRRPGRPTPISGCRRRENRQPSAAPSHDS